MSSLLSLHGVRVLEVAEMVGGPYATKLLADLGAEVIKIEPVTGDRSRHIGPFPIDATGDIEQSGMFLGLNTNKRSSVIDLDSATGRTQLGWLVAQADIVVHDLVAARAAEVGLDGDELLAQHPHLVVAAITPYGHTGPRANWVGDELTVVHGGGWGYQIPGDAPDNSLAPLTVPGWFSYCQAAMATALAALAAHHKSRATGVGEFIDMSVMAQVSAALEAAMPAWTYKGEVASRSLGRTLTPWKIFPCSDGLIFLVTVEQDQWERLVEMMGSPEWATGGLFDTVEMRGLNQDVLNMFLSEWTINHTVDELWHQGQARRICFAPVFAFADLADQEHLIERGFFHQVSHQVAGELTHMGAPSKLTSFVTGESAWSLRSGAPILGADSHAGFADRDFERPDPDTTAIARKPLEGVRVVDFSWVWAGPFATMHLAYLGADVIKVESSQRPSLGRRLPIHPPEVPQTLNTCGYFNQWDQGKRSVELDLTDPASLDQVLSLIAGADVVVDNYATGVMERLGLSDQVLRETNPDLVIASVTGYGKTGPLSHYMGYGPTTCPLSGVGATIGHPGGDPVEAGLSIGDPAAGLVTAFNIMAALFGRARGDGGMRIDTTLWEATAVNMVHGWMGHALGLPAETPNGSRSFAAAPHGVFRCHGQDEWVAIGCLDDLQWRSLARLLGGGCADDPRFATLDARKANEPELEALVGEWTSTKNKWAVARELQSAGVASYPSLSCPEVLADEQHEAREFWEHFDHPEVGVRPHSGVPWRTRNWPNGVTRRAPLIGEHNAEILG